MARNRRNIVVLMFLVALAAFGLATLTLTSTPAKSPKGEQQKFSRRGDIRSLPAPLKSRLIELAGRPHSFMPMQAFSEAPSPSQLFGYYLLDTKNFEPNVFTAIIPGINDGVAPTATGANHDLPTIAAI